MTGGRRVRAGMIVGVVLLGAFSAGCNRQDTLEEEVLGYISRTARLSNRYVYQEAIGDQSVIVRGLVEDDFRFKARVTRNDLDVLDQVVSDDALAVRFLDPSVLPQFLKEPSAETTPLEALSQRRWVVDRAGAPPVGLPVTDPKYAGVDPVADSLGVLTYTRLSITAASGIRKYNPESLDYRPQEDPFPTPQEGSGIDRYDIVLRPFPKPDAVASSGQADAAFASVANFRKMSIYVKDGRVVQVRERIAAEGKVLEKFREYMTAFIEIAGDEQLQKQTQQILDEFEGPQQAELLIAALNVGLVGTGREPVRFRTMTYELRDLGADVAVDLPTNAVEGKLTFFGINAIQQQEDDDAAREQSRTGANASTAEPTAGAAPTASP